MLVACSASNECRGKCGWNGAHSHENILTFYNSNRIQHLMFEFLLFFLQSKILWFGYLPTIPLDRAGSSSFISALFCSRSFRSILEQQRKNWFHILVNFWWQQFPVSRIRSTPIKTDVLEIENVRCSNEMVRFNFGQYIYIVHSEGRSKQ